MAEIQQSLGSSKQEAEIQDDCNFLRDLYLDSYLNNPVCCSCSPLLILENDSNYMETPLHLACKLGNAEAVGYLLSLGKRFVKFILFL